MTPSAKGKDFGWTIVQHSAYGYNNDPGFKAALETRSIRSRAERNMIEREGGMVFEDYGYAEDTAERLNYPVDYNGIYPCYRGRFSTKTVDGLAVAIPNRHVVA